MKRAERHPRKGTIHTVFALAAVLALLAGCGGGAADAGGNADASDEEASGDSEDASLRVWTFLSAEGTSSREVVLGDLIADFESENPGVEVVVEAQPFEELESSFMSAAERDQAPDIIWVRDSFLYLLSDADTLLDLDDHVSQEFADEAIPDMFEVFADKAVFDGERVALPIWPTPAQVLFYRDDVLADAGTTSRHWSGRRSPPPPMISPPMTSTGSACR